MPILEQSAHVSWLASEESRIGRYGNMYGISRVGAGTHRVGRTTPPAKVNRIDSPSSAVITIPPSALTKPAAMPMNDITRIHIPRKTL